MLILSSVAVQSDADVPEKRGAGDASSITVFSSVSNCRPGLRPRISATRSGAFPFRFRVSAVRDGAEAFQAGAAALGREAFPP
jgi:hypothetical protein